MARVIFIADFEEGNIFATFGLAKQLLSNDHEVLYVGVPDAEILIRKEGFGFYPVLRTAYPKGSKFSTELFMTTAESREILCRLFVDEGGELDVVMADFIPDVVVVPPYLSLESLILRVRFGVRIIHLRSAYIVDQREKTIARYCSEIFEVAPLSDRVVHCLRDHGIPTNNMAGIVARISDFPEFVMLPKGYEPQEASSQNTFYIGASLDAARREKPFDWSGVDLSKRLIFCTLGSQAHRYLDRSDRFFCDVLDAVADLDNVFLIIAVGWAAEKGRYRVPSNALVVEWAPQLELLSKSRMMIMHGGMGTTRECILSKVPMLVHPMMRDQFASADAICRHRLGLRAASEDGCSGELRRQIGVVLTSAEIHNHVLAMNEKFLVSEREHRGVSVLEELLGARS